MKPARNSQFNNNGLLIIFTRNPVLGKCKTRLAASIGDEAALEIYRLLLEHTAVICKNLNTAKEVHYSEEIWENDMWEKSVFSKKLQQGHVLGERMYRAFLEGFKKGHKKIVIIGSDLYDLQLKDLETAFRQLDTSDYVLGPALDGGYYLLGMKTLNKKLFHNKDWGSATVLEDTLQDLKNCNVHLLEPKNDIDVYDDIKDLKVFKAILKKFEK